MSHGYVPVNWNRRKQIYDVCVWLCVAVYIALFLGVSNMLYRGTDSITIQILLMRAFSTCAFLMLTVILCIGPLARINRRFLPLLYNRRHLGVSLFVVALLHAAVVVYWYHSFGVVNPIVSIFTSGGVDGAAGADGADNIYRSLGDFPFQAFGAVALVILFLMAATSHDYWNANLGGPLWKAIHMLVYAAYALVIVHITFGALQQDNTGLLPWMAWVSVLLVGGLHLFAGLARAGVVVKLDGDMREWVGSPAAGRTSPTIGPSPCPLPPTNASPSFATMKPNWRRSQMYASTRTGHWGKAGWWTASSPARGTATSTNPKTAARRRRSRKRSKPTASRWREIRYW